MPNRRSAKTDRRRSEMSAPPHRPPSASSLPVAPCFIVLDPFPAYAHNHLSGELNYSQGALGDLAAVVHVEQQRANGIS